MCVATAGRKYEEFQQASGAAKDRSGPRILKEEKNPPSKRARLAI
jgi:hypothetical protein